jgi:hypothetical protein
MGAFSLRCLGRLDTKSAEALLNTPPTLRAIYHQSGISLVSQKLFENEIKTTYATWKKGFLESTKSDRIRMNKPPSSRGGAITLCISSLTKVADFWNPVDVGISSFTKLADIWTPVAVVIAAIFPLDS